VGARESASCAPDRCPAGRRAQTLHTTTRWRRGSNARLDRDAALRPKPAGPETIHRLNRAEYHNAVRDLLALDTAVASLLPADDMSYASTTLPAC